MLKYFVSYSFLYIYFRIINVCLLLSINIGPIHLENCSESLIIYWLSSIVYCMYVSRFSYSYFTLFTTFVQKRYYQFILSLKSRHSISPIARPIRYRNHIRSI